MIILDSTIVNVALPTIEHDLGFSQSSLAWVVNGYLIGFGGLLLLAGRLGDLVGRPARVRRWAHGLHHGLARLRTVDDAGDVDRRPLRAGRRRLVHVGRRAGHDRDALPQPARAVEGDRRLQHAVAAGGGAIGLVAGGLITQAISWHWIFFVNLPIGIATIVMARRLLPDDRGSRSARRAPTPSGALLVTGSLMLGVYTIVADGGLRLDLAAHPGARSDRARRC